mmetsp:Transcript_22680/g.56894  ORF Transcript_22680/g.56894 Transcript_22680/m.56894 type:complete len:219 (-) Transcript_22680:284-940(-)
MFSSDDEEESCTPPFSAAEDESDPGTVASARNRDDEAGSSEVISLRKSRKAPDCAGAAATTFFGATAAVPVAEETGEELFAFWDDGSAPPDRLFGCRSRRRRSTKARSRSDLLFALAVGADGVGSMAGCSTGSAGSCNPVVLSSLSKVEWVAVVVVSVLMHSGRFEESSAGVGCAVGEVSGCLSGHKEGGDADLDEEDHEDEDDEEEPTKEVDEAGRQ